MEGNISFTAPLGPLKHNIPDVKLGLELGYLRQIKADKPLFWGVSLYYTSLGNATATIEEVLDFNLVNFDYSTTSHMVGGNGKLRFYPDVNIGKLEIYTEAQLGYKWLFTSTSKTLSSGQSSSDSHINSTNLSLTYGISAGINYPLKEMLYLNVRVNYLPGISTSYYAEDPKNVIQFSSLDQFNLKNSTTDILRWDIGLTFWPTGDNN